MVGADRQVKVAFLMLRTTLEDSDGLSGCSAAVHSFPAWFLEAR